MTLFTLESNRATDDRYGNAMELFSVEKRPGLEVTFRTERRSLFERYRSAVRAFTQAVDCLDDGWSMEFHTSWERAEAARQRVDTASPLLLA